MVDFAGRGHIFEVAFPEYKAIFMFDNAPCHRKIDDQALNVEKMNVRPGGKQAVMRDTIWNSTVQCMVLPDGTPKGLKLVLEERGVDTKGMVADAMRQKLAEYKDFAKQRTMVEEMVGPLTQLREIGVTPRSIRGLVAMEVLRQIVPEALETVTVELMNKFFVTCRDYERAYRNGNTGEDVEKAVKVYKSHRRVFI